jgi:hypothetical protein
MRITYTMNRKRGTITVCFGSRVVGSIHKTDSGYRYQAHSSLGETGYWGEVLPTIAAVKRSLTVL